MAKENGEKTRDKRTVRTFIDSSGNETNRVTPDVVAFRIELVGLDGWKLEQRLEEYPKEISRAAAAWGYVTNLTNKIGGMDDANDAAEAIESRHELFMSGDWTTERSSGPRSSYLVDAFVRMRSDKGVETSEERKLEFAKSIADPEARKQTLEADENAMLKAYYNTIRAEAALARGKAELADAQNANLESALLK